MQDKALISVASVEAGCGSVVYDVQGGQGIMSSLKSLGITPGKRIVRITPVPVKGPINVEVDKIHVVVGFGKCTVRNKKNVREEIPRLVKIVSSVHVSF